MFGLQTYLGRESRYSSHKKANPCPQLARPSDQVLVSRNQVLVADRTTEWVSAIAMLGIALVFAFPGETLTRTSLAPLKDKGVTEAMLAFVYAGFGSMRLLALWINGRQTRATATVRSVTALVSCLFWSNYAGVIFWNGIYITGVASIGMVTIPIFAYLDFLAIGRAWRDAKYRIRT